MKTKIFTHVESLFAEFENIKSLEELKFELIADLEEHYSDLKNQGLSDDEAYKKTLSSIGDIEETVDEVIKSTSTLERKLLTNFSGRNLPNSDFSNVVVRGGNFKGSALKESSFSESDLTGSNFSGSDLKGSDFSNSDLSGSIFSSSELSNGNFTNSKLKDVKFKAMNLTNSIFDKATLDNASISSCALSNSSFVSSKLKNSNISSTDLKNANFEKCIFVGVDFKYTDFSGVSFKNQILTDVTFTKCGFDKSTSFDGAILNNVQFKVGFTLSNKLYKEISKINFAGSTMDKLTFAQLKSINVDLSNVTVQ